MSENDNLKKKYAVIFTAVMSGDRECYAAAVALLRKKLENHPGFIGLESTEDSDGNEITVSYWDSLEAIKKWKADPDHQRIRKENAHRWYNGFTVTVTKILYQYSTQADTAAL